jgi:hypothetical protein
MGVAVAVVLVALVAGYGAWRAISDREAQIVALRDEAVRGAAELSTVRQDLERRTSERDSARQDADSARADAADRQKLLNASLQAAQDAQARAADLEGRLVTLQGQLADANRRLQDQPAATATAGTTATGPDLAPIVAIDDRLLREGTEYMGHTSDAEAAIRASDYSALAAAFGEMQSWRSRWEALVRERNDAVAKLNAG